MLSELCQLHWVVPHRRVELLRVEKDAAARNHRKAPQEGAGVIEKRGHNVGGCQHSVRGDIVRILEWRSVVMFWSEMKRAQPLEIVSTP